MEREGERVRVRIQKRKAQSTTRWIVHTILCFSMYTHYFLFHFVFVIVSVEWTTARLCECVCSVCSMFFGVCVYCAMPCWAVLDERVFCIRVSRALNVRSPLRHFLEHHRISGCTNIFLNSFRHSWSTALSLNFQCEPTHVPMYNVFNSQFYCI